MIVQNKKAFGSVVSTLIMFIAIVGVTTGMVIAFQNYAIKTQSSLSNQNKFTTNKINTIISVSNIYYNSTSNILYVYLKNIGRTSLSSKNIDYFIDDSYISNFNITDPIDLVTPVDLINPQDTVAIINSITLQPGTHSVRVITEYGVDTEETFNI